MVTPRFATVQLGLASTAGRQAVELVEGLLDQLRPSRLDPAGSTVRVQQKQTVIVLAHTQSSQANLHICVSDSGWTHLYGPQGCSEILSSGVIDRTWANQLCDNVTTILRGTYRVADAGGEPTPLVLDYGCQPLQGPAEA